MRNGFLLLGWFMGFCACGAAPPTNGANAPNDAHSPNASPASSVVTDDDTERVVGVINAERSARELPPVDLVADSKPLATAAEMIRRGSPPDVALRTALGRLVEAESSEGRGWCVPTENLAEPQLPAVVLEDDELTLAVVVVRIPAEKAPPPFVVCYLVVEDGEDLQGK
jgi:hypothetical protein